MLHYQGAFEGHTDAIYSLACDAQGDVYSSGGDAQVVRWQAHQSVGRLLTRLTHSVYAMLPLPKEEGLVVAHNYEGLHVLDLVKNQHQSSFKWPALTFFSMLRYRDQVLVGTSQGTLHSFRLPALSPLKIQDCSKGAVRALALCVGKPDLVLAAGADGFMALFEMPQLKPVGVWEGHHQGTIFSLCMLPHQPNQKEIARFITGGKDGTLRLWGIQHTKARHQPYRLQSLSHPVSIHTAAVYDLCYVKGTQLIAAASRDKTLSLWRLEPFGVVHKQNPLTIPTRKAQTRLQKPEQHTASVNVLAWNSVHKQLLSAGDDRRILQWRIQTR